MPKLTPQSPAWRALEKHAGKIAGTPTRKLFADDPDRFERLSLEAAGLFLDFSKSRATVETIERLMDVAREADLEGRRAAMLSGGAINETERRAVLHVALRDRAQRSYHVDGENVATAVRAELDRVKAFAETFAAGRREGFTGEALDTIVNIGIGGSDLGPAMAARALQGFALDGKRAFFVSNVDGAALARTLDQVDPARTLFVIASKTFTTQETMTNAASARAWLLAKGASDEDVAKHFVAVSTNEAAVSAFGIATENMFRFWDWVGGRFSMWSAIGLPLALYLGFENFERLLAGAHAMDEHFREAPLEANAPVLLAMIGVLNRNILGCAAHAVLPYAEGLSRLPAYLQQLEMESNGKRIALDGTPAPFATCPIVFGEPGTNGQHAFYQLLHQGTDLVSMDLIAAAEADAPVPGHHTKLLANFLAQGEAFMRGRTEAEAAAAMEKAGVPAADVERLAPHRTFPGDRPVTSILMQRLTPETLGALIALYEHKVFCQGVVWGVNSFDQWGVELGKQLAAKLLPGLEGEAEAPAGDASTNGLLARIRTARTPS